MADFTGDLAQIILRSTAAQAVTVLLAMITGLRYIKKKADEKHSKELKDMEKRITEKIEDGQKDTKHDLQILKGCIENVTNEMEVTTKYIDSAINNINQRLNKDK